MKVPQECVKFTLFYYYCVLAYKQDQKGRKEAAADRKKKVQASSTNEPSKLISDRSTETDSAPLTLYSSPVEPINQE